MSRGSKKQDLADADRSISGVKDDADKYGQHPNGAGDRDITALATEENRCEASGIVDESD
jgi:hypothetical protein